jgi:hypothetical protein
MDRNTQCFKSNLLSKRCECSYSLIMEKVSLLSKCCECLRSIMEKVQVYISNVSHVKAIVKNFDFDLCLSVHRSISVEKKTN